MGGIPKEQVECILSQSLVPDEIVICDDDAQDETVDIARNLLADCNITMQIIENPENFGYKKILRKRLVFVMWISFY